MMQKAKETVRYTIATHAAEKMSPSHEAIRLCEKIASGKLTGNDAVEQIKHRYGVESGRTHA